MNPIYRISAEHDPTQPDYLKWTATVYRVSDESYMGGSTRCAATADEAVAACREWIASLSEKKEAVTVYTDEDGDTCTPADLSLVRAYAPDTEPYPTTA